MTSPVIPSQNVYLETPDYDELSPEFLEGLRRKYNAERVVAELNGMRQAADFYMKTPGFLGDRAGGHVC